MNEAQCEHCGNWFDTETSYVLCPECHDTITARLRERQVDDESQW